MNLIYNFLHMLAKIQSVALLGLECHPVEVETDILPGLPRFAVVGLPDAAIEESSERVRSAIRNCDFPYPRTRVVINLAPAHLRKMGPHYDLPIALGILTQCHALRPELLEKTLVVGELGLDGTVRHVRGILPITEFAQQQGFKKILVPKDNASEASMIQGIQIIPIDHLKKIIPILKGQEIIQPTLFKKKNVPMTTADMEDVKGQEQAKRALEIAAAGGHNLLLNGPPGAGKTMMAKVMRSILPSMTMEEALEVSKVYSVAGRLPKNEGLVTQRPFRVIHHTASSVSIVGGGNPPRPGEISLAHRGVLFLDELAEFPKSVLEVLRQPMEDRVITISRAQGSFVYPAQFTMIAAMNPCPCGYHNTPGPTQRCQCNAWAIQRYQRKISGPLLDRMDMHLFINQVDPRAFRTAQKGESSSAVRQRVEKARRLQKERFDNERFFANSEMDNRAIEKYCPLNPDAESLLYRFMQTTESSARGYYRIIKVARTIADLEGSQPITSAHIAEAIQYRQRIFKF